MAELYDFPQGKPEQPETLPDPGERAVSRRQRTRRGRLDIPFLVLTLLLLAAGLVMLLSASYAIAYFDTVTDTGEANPMQYFTSQVIYAAMGILALFVVSFIPMSFLRKLSFLSILAALGLTNMWIAVFADVGVAVLAILNAMRMLKK